MEAAHTQGKLHSHCREIHILSDDDHTCIAAVNNALLDPEPVARELLRRWNSHDVLVKACKEAIVLRKKADHIIGHVYSAHPLSLHVCGELDAVTLHLQNLRNTLEAALELAKKG